MHHRHLQLADSGWVNCGGSSAGALFGLVLLFLFFSFSFCSFVWIKTSRLVGRMILLLVTRKVRDPIIDWLDLISC